VVAGRRFAASPIVREVGVPVRDAPTRGSLRVWECPPAPTNRAGAVVIALGIVGTSVAIVRMVEALGTPGIVGRLLSP